MICKAKPYMGNEPYIFFSYCHADAENVYPIIERMVQDGYRIWYDEGISPGTDYPQQIADRLSNAKVCLASVTEASCESHNCRNEMTFAVNHKIPLLTLKFGDFELPLSIEIQIASTQMIIADKYTMRELTEKIYACEMLHCCKGEKQTLISDAEIVAYEEELRGRQEAENEIRRQNVCKALASSFVTGNREHEEKRIAESVHMNAEKSDEIHQKIADAEAALSKAEAFYQQALRKAENQKAHLNKAADEWKKRERELQDTLSAAKIALARAEEEVRQAEAEQQTASDAWKAEKEQLETMSASLDAQVQKEKQAADAQRANLDALRIRYAQLTQQEDALYPQPKQAENDEKDMETVFEDNGDTSETVWEENAFVLPLLIRLSNGNMYECRPNMTSVGRDPRMCDIAFPDAKDLLETHAYIIVKDGRNLIINCDSSNPISINGQPLAPKERLEIMDYAEISLTQTEQFLAVFGQTADAVRNNMYVMSLRSVETGESVYFFGNQTVMLGRLRPWASGAMRSKSVSREQAKLCISGTVCSFVNLSGHGSIRNTEMVGKNEEVTLQNGDQLRFGTEHFVFSKLMIKKGSM